MQPHPDKNIPDNPAPEAAPDAVTPEIPARAPQYGGWARMDSDAVLRGWARDRADASRRLDVEIFIDDQRIAVLRADALDPKLVQLGQGDGRYAFAFLTPPDYRDGRPHSFHVRVRQAPYTLKCKQDSFDLPPSATPPKLEVTVVSFGSIRGWLHGGQYAKSIRLALWADGNRIDPDLDTQWSGSGDAREFLFEPSGEILDRLCRQSLTLAAPGMAEAGYPVARLDRLSLGLRARIDADGEVRVRFFGDTTAINGETVWFRLTRNGESQAPDLEGAPVQQGNAQFRLPSGLDPEGLEVRVVCRGTLLSSLWAPLRQDCRDWLQNPGFRHWGPDGVAHWNTARSAGRGFFAFPPAQALAYGLTGDVLRFDLAEERNGDLLLGQEFQPHRLSAGALPVSAMVRSDREITLALALTNPAGRAVGRAEIVSSKDWRFLTVDIPCEERPGEPLTLTLCASVTAGTVEVAGLTIGDSFEVYATAEDVPQQPGQLAVNTDLVQWPSGILRDNLIGRSELARGWYGANHRSAAPISVRALTNGNDEGDIALAVAVPEVPEYFRLEIRLHPETALLSRGMLDFEIGSPPAARRLFQSAVAGLPEYGEIERIQIVRRRTEGVVHAEPGSDELLVVLARRLMIDRSYHRFRLPFSLDATGSQAIAPGERPDEEYFLVFEFRQPCAFAVRRLRLTSQKDARPASPPAFLALEDRNIEAHARRVRGLESWVSTTVQSATGEASPGGDSGPWLWSLAPAGGVEVLVCGAEAPEAMWETLAGLGKGSAVPRTVRLVAQSPDRVAIAGLEAAVAGQPWTSWLSPSGLGRVEQLDAAIRSSDASWVVVLEAGDQVTDGWLEALVGAVGADPEVALAGPLSNAAFLGLMAPDRLPDLSLTPLVCSPGVSPTAMALRLRGEACGGGTPVPVLGDAGLMIRRSSYLAAGGLNPAAFQTSTAALLDLAIRIAGSGQGLRMALDSYVHRPPAAGAGTPADISRVELAKLASLHPDWDLGSMLQKCRDLPALARLRQGLPAISEPGQGRGEGGGQP
jgi:hypothetical protein